LIGDVWGGVGLSYGYRKFMDDDALRLLLRPMLPLLVLLLLLPMLLPLLLHVPGYMCVRAQMY